MPQAERLGGGLLAGKRPPKGRKTAKAPLSPAGDERDSDASLKQKQHEYRVKQEDREQQLLEKYKKGAQ